MTVKTIFSMVVVACALIVVGCSGQTSEDSDAPEDGAATLQDQLESADVDVDVSDSEVELTVFAPSTDALASAEAEYPDLAGDPDLWAVVLKSHVAVGDLDATALRDAAGTSLETLSGIPLAVEVEGDRVRVGGAEVGDEVDGTSPRTYQIREAIIPDGLGGG